MLLLNKTHYITHNKKSHQLIIFNSLIYNNTTKMQHQFSDNHNKNNNQFI